MELENIKAILKGILVSARNPITMEQLKIDYEEVAFESLEEKMFQLGYGAERGWNDPQIWNDFSLIMQRTPNGLIRCPQSGPLERLITSTKSKKGKTGRLSMSSQDSTYKLNFPSKKKKRETPNLQIDVSSMLPPIRLKSKESSMAQPHMQSLIPSRKKKECTPSQVKLKSPVDSPPTTDSDEGDENISPVTTDSDEELNAFFGSNRPIYGPK